MNLYQSHATLFNKKIWLIFLLLIGSILIISSTVEAVDSTIYVKANATGANNGTSWTNAYTSLQTALSNASAGDQIWVATGTYKPTTGSSRTSSFEMKSGIKVFGGFAGTENSLSQRNISANPTILTGDLQGNDNNNMSANEATRQDNSYSVVFAEFVDSTAKLDGFIIRGGNANGSGDGDFTIHLDHGGGIFLYGSTMILSNLLVINNTAVKDGGGIADFFGDGTLANVRFFNNVADRNGGGFTNNSGSPTMMNAVFSGNKANGFGGALSSSRSTNFQIVNATFSQNSAPDYYSGAIGHFGGDINVSNSIFWANGFEAIFSYTPNDLQIEYSVVQGGHSGTGNISSDPQLADADGPDNVPGTTDDKLSLLPSSPAIDAGNNSTILNDTADLDTDDNTAEETPLDLALNNRRYNHPAADTGSGSTPLVDMGAFEAQQPPTPVNVSGEVRLASNNASVQDVLVSVLQIEHIEVTQAVQDVNNSIPLVQDKPTIARIYAGSDGTSSPTSISVLLKGTRNNAPLPGSPLTVGPANLAQTANPSRANYGSSFNTLLPASWLSGNVKLTAELDTSAGYADLTNSTGDYTLSLPPGTYTITPRKSGMTFNPASRTVTFPTAQSIDFTAEEEMSAPYGVYLPVISGGSGSSSSPPNGDSQQTTVNATFNELPPLRLTIVPIRYTSAIDGQTYQPPSDFTSIVDGLKTSFPVDDVILTTHPTINVSGVPGQESATTALDAIKMLKTNESAPYYEVYYGVMGVLSDADIGDTAGVAGWPRVAAGHGNQFGLAAHEIGHTFGLGHSCNDPNFPNNSGTIGEYGLDVSTETLYSPNVSDFMSTTPCPVTPTYVPGRWFSAYHYERLYNDQLNYGNTVGLRGVQPHDDQMH